MNTKESERDSKVKELNKRFADQLVKRKIIAQKDVNSFLAFLSLYSSDMLRIDNIQFDVDTFMLKR